MPRSCSTTLHAAQIQKSHFHARDNRDSSGLAQKQVSEAGSEPAGHSSLLRDFPAGQKHPCNACRSPAATLLFLHTLFQYKTYTRNHEQHDCNDWISLVSPSPNGSYLLTLCSSCRRQQEIARLFQGNTHSHQYSQPRKAKRQGAHYMKAGRHAKPVSCVFY